MGNHGDLRTCNDSNDNYDTDDDNSAPGYFFSWRSQYCYTNPNNYFWAGLYLYDMRHMNLYLSICIPFLVNFCQCCSVLSACFLFFFFVYYCLVFGEVKMKLIRKFLKSTISENSGFSKTDQTKNLFIYFYLTTTFLKITHIQVIPI